MIFLNRAVAFLFILILIICCGQSVSAKHVNTKYIAIGQASWYGSSLHGRKTASGVVFNKNLYTAAHRSLPFGSIIKVTNLHNGKHTLLIVNDRGPFSKNRILDVSEKAASYLGFKNNGVNKIKMEYLQKKSTILRAKAKSNKIKVICDYFAQNRN